MKELVEKMVQYLVDEPDKVEVKEIDGDQANILEIRVSKQDIGRVLGKQGTNINALRTIVSAVGGKRKKRYFVELIDDKPTERREGF
jgi:predicted RNA-binding protein YlqC (UPF0109 family)